MTSLTPAQFFGWSRDDAGPLNEAETPRKAGTFLQTRLAKLNDDRFYRRLEAMQAMTDAQGKRRQG